jgi:hypothetical protein
LICVASANGRRLLSIFEECACGRWPLVHPSGWSLFRCRLVFQWMGEKTVFKTATSPDSSAKATLYQVDVGAAGATRTYVALSNPQVDGTKKGNIVLTLTNLQKNADQIGLAWEANRLLVITYPGGGQVEYAVSKIRGITIELVVDQFRNFISEPTPKSLTQRTRGITG